MILILYYVYNNFLNNANAETLKNLKTYVSTMHIKCTVDSECGSLVCDEISHRCKKKIGENCAMDIDCKNGYCNNWKCDKSPGKIVQEIKEKTASKVHFDI